ncbi:cytochrome c oxidase subunit CcoM [Marinobacter koreensis]|uniref:Uncharacterized protein n=2 Tax=Marinobacter TaxID=2742 RepID=M7CWQ4_9GAMM|nr:cytochrome c oxidase subunit CcoM [Marinobacter koreensis]EMP56675.1 hypothetical protein MSNKSG1_05051 [Marinobacter santoriniensis NKSG1]MCK7548269.1 hypothetical protein [Marinobacter koreensis]
MYMDSVVIAGIVTVLLMLGFFIGVGIFVMRDEKRHGHAGLHHHDKSGGNSGKH